MIKTTRRKPKTTMIQTLARSLRSCPVASTNDLVGDTCPVMLAHTECKLESQPSLTSQAFVGIPGTEKRFVLLVSLLALAIPVASQQPDISPFLGTWTLNAAESKLGTLPHPVRFAVTFEVLGSDGMKVSTDQVYEDSRSVGHYDVRFDGYNHPAAAGLPDVNPSRENDGRAPARLSDGSGTSAANSTFRGGSVGQ